MVDKATGSAPVWFWLAAAAGLAWNVFGIVQFLSTTGVPVDALVKGGMSQEQAEFYFKLPILLHVFFAVGVFGGALGCILLGLRKRVASTVLVVSLVAYVILFAMDAALGVFTVFGASQVVILSTVVLVAAALCWLAVKTQQRGILR
ncbi:MAG: hypothetical protein RL323_1767 [Pseudomonadota bacterium]|jgi:hypothetical protein